jgi:hypothetical protein
VVAINAKRKEILSLFISKERNMFVAEKFLSDIVRDYEKHNVLLMAVHNTQWPSDSMDLNIISIPLWIKV